MGKKDKIIIVGLVHLYLLEHLEKQLVIFPSLRF